MLSLLAQARLVRVGLAYEPPPPQISWLYLFGVIVVAVLFVALVLLLWLAWASAETGRSVDRCRCGAWKEAGAASWRRGAVPAEWDILIVPTVCPSCVRLRRRAERRRTSVAA